MKTPIINEFKHDYRFLSNFYENDINMKFSDGSVYTFISAEQMYQFSKCSEYEDAIKILECKTSAEAKRVGKKVKLRDNWEYQKVEVMYHILRRKFMDKKLADMLVSTNNAILVEGNIWNDTFWGVCNGVGSNILGQLLMMVRSNIQIRRNRINAFTIQNKCVYYVE